MTKVLTITQFVKLSELLGVIEQSDGVERNVQNFTLVRRVFTSWALLMVKKKEMELSAPSFFFFCVFS